MKTLIIGASGKIGRYLLEYGNVNYVYTYNKRKIHKGMSRTHSRTHKI